jgi:putative membrane protein
MGRLRAAAATYLKGVCMGAADAVPGVSGGTIALLLGIYERLIAAITGVDADRLRDLLSAGVALDRERLRASLVALDAGFVAALGLGIASALVTVATVVAGAVETAPVPTFAFFFGLIAASAVVLRREVHLGRWRERVAAVAGFALAFVASGQASASLGHGPVVTVLAGTVAVSAMILPGISGSLILLVLGQYVFLTGRLRAVRDAVLALPAGGSLDAVVEPGTSAALFVAGAAVGLLTVAHLVRRALAADRRATMAFLVALVVGALRAPVERVLAGHAGPWTAPDLATVTAAALVGAVLVVGMDRLAGGMVAAGVTGETEEGVGAGRGEGGDAAGGP